MPGVGVQWQADLGPLGDLKTPSGLHIGPWGEVGWNGPLVVICGNPPAQQVALLPRCLKKKKKKDFTCMSDDQLLSSDKQ